MPDIFHEVNEDLRAEKAQAFLRRYAGAGIAVVVLILATTLTLRLVHARIIF